MLILILLTALTGVCGLLFGAVCGVFFGGRSRQSEAIVLSFSAGAMIALVCFELLHEAMETGIHTSALCLVMLLGAGVVTLLDYVVDKRSGHSHDFITCEDCDEEFEHDEKHEHCTEHDHDQAYKHGSGHEHGNGHEHHHSHGHEHEHSHDHAHTDDHEDHDGHAVIHEHHHKRTSGLQLFIAGSVMAGAVAIHNIPEGMSIGAIYAGEGGVVTGALVMLLISIVLHNVPEGMAISVPLTTGGMRPVKACAIAALSGVPTIIGAMLGYVIGDMGPMGLAVSLSFAAGTLLYVVFGEVLPQAINLYCSRKTAFAAIAGLAAGMLILAGHIH
ncbi:MAG: ZIP family metal transporter [Eubacteriales bacterium]|nr:ZIP family metal transporter [Eubacteriales bacterium]